jgi:hypothetical protein
MARRNRQSISSFLISVLGMLCLLKVFVWVVETKVLHTPIKIPFLNYGIIIVIVLLLLRVSFVLIKNKTRKSNHIVQDSGNDSTVYINKSAFQCADCGKKVSEKVRIYCLERPNKFNNQVFCYDHQK